LNNLEEKQVTKYLIPANVTTRWELIPGFGWSEMRLVIAALIIGALIFFGLSQIKKTTLIDPTKAPITATIGAQLNKDGQYVKVTPVIPAMVRFFILILPGTVTFFLVKKESYNNMSLLQLYTSAKELKEKQRLYLYKYNSGSEG
jgi:hypothetical protein